MAKKVHVLSAELARELPQIVAAVRRQIHGDLRTNDPNPGRAPDGYVAWIPSGGIPARRGRKVRSRLCAMYRETKIDADTKRLDQIVDGYGNPYRIRVYNLECRWCPGGRFAWTDLVKGGTRYVRLPQRCYYTSSSSSSSSSSGPPSSSSSGPPSSSSSGLPSSSGGSSGPPSSAPSSGGPSSSGGSSGPPSSAPSSGASSGPSSSAGPCPQGACPWTVVEWGGQLCWLQGSQTLEQQCDANCGCQRDSGNLCNGIEQPAAACLALIGAPQYVGQTALCPCELNA